ncbi:MAG: circularly permuted type 2 ATP-grasp protein [Qingshengfaniella sp.]
MGPDDDQIAAQTALLARYAVPPGAADELFGPDGAIRPVWQPFITHLARLNPEELALRFARGDRYLNDAGIFYRKYEREGSSVRAWPLSHLPVIIHDGEWAHIAEGLIQRAELLEQLAADLYGPNRMVSEGHLPAALVAQNPAWLRPLVGLKPANGTYLNFVAFEIGRGPDGQWWVLGDRTEAPSGAGFALENRVAVQRIFPNFFARSNVHRLAGFFRAFRATLGTLRTVQNGEIAMLTPGPMNDGYFEHTYIARYLGLLLAEGGDLTERGGQIMIRTVEGLRPVSVLWRRQDSETCDPLELNEQSRIGTPGLVEAVRQQQVSIVNALGTGILETRALMAFLPQISEALTGSPLRLPNIATWWCGQPTERDHVLANHRDMMIGSAYATRLPFDAPDSAWMGADMGGDGGGLIRLLVEQGADLVGQEAVTLSTTPVWDGAGLVPRPVTLRVFVARTAQGWRVMPGGYARIGAGEQTAALAMQQGGTVADVWVLSDTPVPHPTLLSGTGETAAEHSLPSRTADNLYWLGRYIERAEGQMRLFRAFYGRVAEGAAANGPLLGAVAEGLGLDPEQGPGAMAERFEAPLFAARDSAANARDRFSVDGFMALQTLAARAEKMRTRQVPVDEIPGKVSILLRMVTGFSGLVHENMYRSSSWRFLSLGMSLERAAEMATLLGTFVSDDAPDGMLDLVLELGDSTLTHRARYALGASATSVMDLMALDEANPRAILYHLTRAKEHIAHLPVSAADGRMSSVARRALELHTDLTVATPDSLNGPRLIALRDALWALSDLITGAYLR